VESRKECSVKDSKQLVVSSLLLAAVAGATFALVRALGRLVMDTIAEVGTFQDRGAGMYETGAIPVIVSADGRGPGLGEGGNP
jgi:hypothetical protein